MPGRIQAIEIETGAVICTFDNVRAWEAIQAQISRDLGTYPHTVEREGDTVMVKGTAYARLIEWA